MPKEYPDLVMDELRRGRLRFGRNDVTGEGILSMVVTDGEGGESRIVPVARLVACPPTEMPEGAEVAEA